jgi:hypothetical protein
MSGQNLPANQVERKGFPPNEFTDFNERIKFFPKSG